MHVRLAMRAILLAALVVGLLAPALAAPAVAQSCTCDPNILLVLVTGVVLPCVGQHAAYVQGQGPGCALLPRPLP